MNYKSIVLATAFTLLSAVATAKFNEAIMTLESVVLTFSNGSSQLNSEEMTKLKKAISEIKQKGKIAKIELAAWSDKNHPLNGDLAKSDESLANERIETIKNSLNQEIGRFDYIKSYNMAESANWLQRKMHTDESKLDAVFSKKEKDSMERQDFALMKRDGAPSKAVVILKIRQ